MIHRLLASIASCALLTILAGCTTTSPPVSYIQLSDGGVPLGTSNSPRVLVDAVAVPDFLLRNELLMRVDEHRLRYNTSARWAEPVDIGVQRVLTARLSAALDSFAIFSFPSGRSGRNLDWQVDVTLRNFEAIGTDVVLKAAIQLHPRDEQDVIIENFEARQRLATSDPTAVAAGLSALLGQLADAIAARIQGTEGATTN
jgi:uncharacterized lipoprotein YmbA